MTLQKISNFFKPNRQTLLRNFLVFLPITAAGTLLDYWVKQLAVTHLRGREPLVLIKGVFQLVYVENRGAAFSILQGKRTLFLVMTFIVLVCILFVLYKGVIAHPLGVSILGICTAGTLGNFIDRLRQGYVVDLFEPLFIQFAVFNVADVFLTVGGVLFILYYLLFFEKHRAAQRGVLADGAADTCAAEDSAAE